MIVLDANVLIAYLDADDAHNTVAELLLADVVDEDLAVSTFTLADVLVAPIRDGAVETTTDLLGALEVRELALPPDTARRLAQLRVTTGLKLPDCCVLLAAQDASARVGSFDARLAREARALGLSVIGA